MFPVDEFFKGLYYSLGTLAFLGACIRILYGWFRDYDNAVRFTVDMATNHLPAIYDALEKIAAKTGVELDRPPTINFSTSQAKPLQRKLHG